MGNLTHSGNFDTWVIWPKPAKLPASYLPFNVQQNETMEIMMTNEMEFASNNIMARESTSEAGSGADTATLMEEGSAFAALEGGRIAELKRRDPLPGASDNTGRSEHFDAVIIGAGQAGLSAGYHLARQGVDFVILEAGKRIGDSWRNRWDSLRLFTPARFDSLEGMTFPTDGDYFPTKDEMADYLETYAKKFRLPVRLNAKVDRLYKDGDAFVILTGDKKITADQVIVAAASYQQPKIPEFAKDLDQKINRLHSSAYRNPSQMRAGDVLLVGAGNSGAEIAMDLASKHKIWLSGRDVGSLPFRIGGFLGRKILVRLVLRGVFHHILTTRTPIGRKVKPHVVSHGGPLIRQHPADLKKAGVERVGRITGVKDGLPCLEDGRTLDVANIVWCTGFYPALEWIELPIFDEDARPRQNLGAATDQPGLYFVGLHFLYSMSSTMIHGVGRDARRIADHVAARMKERIAA
jgi:putative flavoprotein involved in K+ transport